MLSYNNPLRGNPRVKQTSFVNCILDKQRKTCEGETYSKLGSFQGSLTELQVIRIELYLFLV